MDEKPELSAGSLEKIIKEKTQQNQSSIGDKPLVQILGIKSSPSSNYLQCVLFDGIHTTKHAIIRRNPQIDGYYLSEQMEKFSVIRLEEYLVSTHSPNDIDFIVISAITPVMRGSQINEKLEVFPPLEEQMDTSLDQSFPSNPIKSEAPFMPSLNQEFKPSLDPSANQSAIPRPMSRPIDRSKLCSIRDIHPYFNSFVIRVRIATKSAVKTYSGRDGKGGKLFSFDATDETSEIRITAFNTECDKYFNLIEKDFIYFISKGSVKNANKRYSNLKSEYEITLNSDSLIEICEQTIALPSIQFKFVPIARLVALNNGRPVDVLGVITSVEAVQTTISKRDQNEVHRRELRIVDKTLHEIRFTLWGEEANSFDGKSGQVLAIKSALVGDFGGRSLRSVQSSFIELDPDLIEAHVLKGWYDKEVTNGGLKNVLSLSKRIGSQSNQIKYLCKMNLRSVPEGSVVYYNCKATVFGTNRADKQLYKSCKKCLKKVFEDINGLYPCEKCGTESTEYQWSITLSLQCGDCTADTWITAFQGVAEKIIGKSVAELSQVFELDPNQYESLISVLVFKTFIFRLGSKVNEYNNEKRIKSTCYGVTPIDAIKRSKQLIRSIKCLK